MRRLGSKFARHTQQLAACRIKDVVARVPPRIGLTLGDPAGVGPELVLRALADPAMRAQARLTVYGSASLLRRVAETAHLSWPSELQVVSSDAQPSDCTPVLYDFAFPDAASLKPGCVHAACGAMAARWIEAATHDAQAGRIDALVTAPINKEALSMAGVPYPGHTEMLAALTGAHQTAMLFWSPDLMVSLATIHVPLSAVPQALTIQGLIETIRLTAAACARFNPADRRPIAVLALNPHAGEHGLFGSEEKTIIVPAIAAAQAEGLAVTGPLVPDVAFGADMRKRHAAYVAMYHDQGLIPFKMLAFESGVNVTLGLPIIRTSPDHGTAFDIAWKGVADASSLYSAIRCAASLASRQPEKPR